MCLFFSKHFLCPLSFSLEATSTQIISEGIHAWSAPLSIKSQADDSPLLRSLSPVLPLSQSSPGRGQEVSLANVFVPLDTIKPSEFTKWSLLTICLSLSEGFCSPLECMLRVLDKINLRSNQII